MFNNIFPPKSCPLWSNVEKCGRARLATDDNRIQHRIYAIFMWDN